MTKLLIISGPTATGKTALAVKLAKKFNGQLISADSRQIYRGMNIGTGKDHPKNIKIDLVDIINPSDTFSVAQYRPLALAKIKEIQTRGQLPIIVGGTGQYIDSITNPQPTFIIKPNKFLRFFLNKFPLLLLQKTYFILDGDNFLLLNNSDRHNPHRLIRKIEIKLSNQKIQNQKPKTKNYLHISLTAPNQFLYSRIDKRVDQRLKAGLFNEIKNLLKKYKWSAPGLNCLGYKQFRSGFTSENVDRWLFNEHSLARRQLTWFKKQKNITFIDISQSGFEGKINRLVLKYLR